MRASPGRPTAVEWLHAAEADLERAYEELSCKRYRPGVAFARRAASSAWTAVLASRLEPPTGRSTRDRLQAFASDESTPPLACAAANRLLEATANPDLAWIGEGPLSVAHDAGRVLGWCRLLVEHAEATRFPGVDSAHAP